MKLQRYMAGVIWSADGETLVSRTRQGIYIAADVDALLARIREAVGAEREAVFRHVVARGRDSGAAMQGSLQAAAALDALLSRAETVHQCPPDGSGIMPCCGRIPFDLIGDRMADDPKLVTCKGRTS